MPTGGPEAKAGVDRACFSSGSGGAARRPGAGLAGAGVLAVAEPVAVRVGRTGIGAAAAALREGERASPGGPRSEGGRPGVKLRDPGPQSRHLGNEVRLRGRAPAGAAAITRAHAEGEREGERHRRDRPRGAAAAPAGGTPARGRDRRRVVRGAKPGRGADAGPPHRRITGGGTQTIVGTPGAPSAIHGQSSRQSATPSPSWSRTQGSKHSLAGSSGQGSWQSGVPSPSPSPGGAPPRRSRTTSTRPGC
jgi:hypothetical protein